MVTFDAFASSQISAPNPPWSVSTCDNSSLFDEVDVTTSELDYLALRDLFEYVSDIIIVQFLLAPLPHATPSVP